MNNRDGGPARLIKVPVLDNVNISTVWEHRPADYYKYGGYPRYISPPGRSQNLRWKWKLVEAHEREGK